MFLHQFECDGLACHKGLPQNFRCGERNTTQQATIVTFGSVGLPAQEVKLEGVRSLA
jgi:hypothetical protein